jgi:peptide deformylase
VGLAANQVDLPLRLFVVNLGAKPGEGEELVFLNPVLTHAKGADEAEEGCLSLPGLYGLVRRHKQIRISAYNLAGEEFRQDVTGLMARVVQHEFDHLNGVLFPDRMSDEHRLRLLLSAALVSAFSCSSGTGCEPRTARRTRKRRKPCGYAFGHDGDGLVCRADF